MAQAYAGARPPYPPQVFQTLLDEGVIGPGLRVLEVGAGSGMATRELTASGSEVAALEPGRELAALLRTAAPEAEVHETTLEEARLAPGSVDSAVAATAMHWVDLRVGLPVLHAALRPQGRLAVWRHVFGDPSVHTTFRGRVGDIVRARADVAGAPARGHEPPTMEELAVGGWFRPLTTLRWRWSIELTATQVRRLFATFSDWSPAEVEVAGAAVDELGGSVLEHYQTVLHLLMREDRDGAHGSGWEVHGSVSTN